MPPEDVDYLFLFTVTEGTVKSHVGFNRVFSVPRDTELPVLAKIATSMHDPYFYRTEEVYIDLMQPTGLKDASAALMMKTLRIHSQNASGEETILNTVAELDNEAYSGFYLQITIMCILEEEGVYDSLVYGQFCHHVQLIGRSAAATGNGKVRCLSGSGQAGNKINGPSFSPADGDAAFQTWNW